MNSNPTPEKPDPSPYMEGARKAAARVPFTFHGLSVGAYTEGFAKIIAAFAASVAEPLEAENARLLEALEEIKRQPNAPHGLYESQRIARAALSPKEKTDDEKRAAPR